MKKTQKIKKKVNDFLYDHLLLREVLSGTKTLFLSILAAIIFAVGFTCFVTPPDDSGLTIVTGGVSGLAQNIFLFLQICGLKNINIYDAQSIFYTVINIPITIFAYIFIGKKFAIYSVINVVASSIFISLIPKWGISTTIATSAFIQDETLVRVLFAGMCTGVSSAIAFAGDFSCGGIDIFTYYFALKKSTSVGKYAVLFNGVIVTLHAVLLFASVPSQWEEPIVATLFSAVYLFIVSLIIDSINVRNKKVQLQIISSSAYMSDILIAYFPHGATLIKGKGAYSGAERNIITMVVSSSEVKMVVRVAKKVDVHAFIAVTPLIQVFGNFFIRPVE